MDLVKIRDKGNRLMGKYKYVFLIIIIGIVLMLLPSGKSEASTTSLQLSNSREPDTLQSVCEALEELLGAIQGAGKVRVMLTVSKGEETLYQENGNESTSENGTSYKYETVVVSDSGRNELGLIRQINPPTYLGAVVVCQGADSAQVRLSIVEAVSKLTGLGVNQISVVKMK